MTLLFIILLIVVCFMAIIILALINGQDLKSFEIAVLKFIMIRVDWGRKKVDDAPNNTDFKQKNKKNKNNRKTKQKN